MLNNTGYSTNQSFHGRPRAWAREHLPSPGKVEVLYRVKKNSIAEVSLNGFDAIGHRVCLGLGLGS